MGEIRAEARGNEFALLIPQKKSSQLGLGANASYELIRVKEGIWVLTAEETPEQEENPLDRTILSMLRQKSLHERVEGKFERSLNKQQLERFREMLKEGRIVAFRLSKKYKKAVYKTREELRKGKPVGKESENPLAKNKPIEDYCLETDGFLVCKNDERAKALSSQFKQEIEEGKIKGIKNFEGAFYIIEETLYGKYRSNVLSAIKASGETTLQKLAERVGISALLAKIVCEFLKDEGEIIEKRKELFKAVE